MRILLITLCLLPMTAFASAECAVHPKEEWASEDTLKQALTEEGVELH